jgi:hypothetical protein
MTKTLLMAYDGHTIPFRDDGWFNATVAASRYDKRPYDWLRLPDTVSYISALKRKYGKISYFKTTRGKYGGTWMHPKLAVAFARWLDVDFAVWADEQIETIIHGSPEQTDWRRLRHQAASSYKVMSDVLTESRADAGKDTKPHHYANEAKLVNWAISGEYAPLDRASLSGPDLDLLAKLEARNATLIAKGAERSLRKELLQAIAESTRKKQIKDAHGLYLVDRS